MLDSQRLGELWQHPADPCLAEAHIWAGVPAKPPLSQASLLLLEHPVLVTSPWLHLCFWMLFLGYYGRCSYLCCGAAPALGVEVRGATVEFLRELLEASREKPVWLGSLGAPCSPYGGGCVGKWDTLVSVGCISFGVLLHLNDVQSVPAGLGGTGAGEGFLFLSFSWCSASSGDVPGHEGPVQPRPLRR